MKELTEFGERIVQLCDGRDGLRAGLHCTVREADPAKAGTTNVLDFIASDETVDRYNEVIKLGGWDLTAYKKNPVIVDSHNYRTVANILGRSLLVEVANAKLVNRVEFATENPLGNMAFKMAKGGFIRGESVGFIPIEWKTGGKNEPERTYTKQELLEISLVAIPANPGATVGLALKAGVIEGADLRDLAEMLKQFCSDAPRGINDSPASGGPSGPIPQGGADAAANARASGGRVHDAHLLRLARDLRDILKRA